MSDDIVYLDYDGVLHPDAVYRHRDDPIVRLRAPGHALFESAPTLADALLPYPQVRIVLTTSWVYALGYQRAKNCLPEALASRVIGATFHSRMDRYDYQQQTRGAQVHHDIGRRRPRRWVALDDTIEGWIYSPHGQLVHCRSDVGLQCPETCERLQRALHEHFG